MKRRVVVAAALAAALIACAASVTLEAQCSMCRTLLATPEGERIAAALRSGIWLLLAAPVAVFAVIAVAAMKSRRRFELEATHQAAPPPEHHSRTR